MLTIYGFQVLDTRRNEDGEVEYQIANDKDWYPIEGLKDMRGEIEYWGLKDSDIIWF